MKRVLRCAMMLALLFAVPTYSFAAEEPATGSAGPKTILLWPEGAPGAKGDKPNDKPQITVYLPPKDKATGTGVVIFPGGGYGGLAMDHEGHQIAKFFNDHGVAGFILEYRHKGKGYMHPHPLMDAQRAIRLVRSKAADFGIKDDQIGILGFSAGGHLASTAETHFDAGQADAKDPIDRASCRPDFAVLCYPVVAFDQPFTHRGSQYNLIGKDAPKELVESLSNEKQVTKDTPPTFLFHTDQDTGVPPENSIVFYLALKKAKVPAELHVYEKGGHGVGLGKNIPGTAEWSDALIRWMQGRKLIPAATASKK